MYQEFVGMRVAQNLVEDFPNQRLPRHLPPLEVNRD
jgi:hypothetical protein